MEFDHAKYMGLYTEPEVNKEQQWGEGYRRVAHGELRCTTWLWSETMWKANMKQEFHML